MSAQGTAGSQTRVGDVAPVRRLRLARPGRRRRRAAAHRPARRGAAADPTAARRRHRTAARSTRRPSTASPQPRRASHVVTTGRGRAGRSCCSRSPPCCRRRAVPAPAARARPRTWCCSWSSSLALAQGPTTGCVVGLRRRAAAGPGAAGRRRRSAAGRSCWRWSAGSPGAPRTRRERSALVPVARGRAGLGRGRARLRRRSGSLLGDPRVDVAALLRALPTAVLYDVVLAPFVVPLLMRLARRVEPVDDVRSDLSGDRRHRRARGTRPAAALVGPSGPPTRHRPRSAPGDRPVSERSRLRLVVLQVLVVSLLRHAARAAVVPAGPRRRRVPRRPPTNNAPARSSPRPSAA